MNLILTKTFVSSIIIGCMLLIGVINCSDLTVEGTKISSQCSLMKYCQLLSYGVLCDRFESFDQLVYNSSNCSRIYSSVNSLYLMPTQIQLLDLNKFDLSSFIDFTFGFSSSSISALAIYNLTGFVFSDNFARLRFRDFSVNRDEFEFYSPNEHSSLVKLGVDCAGYNLLSRKQKIQIELFWNAFDRMSLYNLGFPSGLCPMIFNNVKMSLLRIRNPKIGRQFNFDQNDKQSQVGNVEIKTLEIDSWHTVNLNRRLLHPQIFSRLETLNIVLSCVNEIELDIFKHFVYLRRIFLDINNLKNLYHSKLSGSRWMEYLNFNQSSFNFGNKTKLTDDEINLIHNNGLLLTHQKQVTSHGSLGIVAYLDYSYPDEDFCLFVKFPFDRLVIYRLVYGMSLVQNCSCTMAWLFQYYFVFMQADFNQIDNWIFHFDCLGSESNLSQYLVKCDFKKRAVLCDIDSNVKLYSDIYIQSYYLDQAIKSAELFILSPVKSVISFIGATSNILALLTILYNWKRRAELMNKQKNQSEEIYLLKEPLYRQMLISSISNALFCLLFFLDSVIPCDKNMSQNQASICFHKDLGISIVESFLKLVSNFCLLQMSVHRYMLIGKEHSKILERVSNVRARSFAIFVLLFSSGLTSIAYFEQTYWSPVRNIEERPGWVLYKTYNMFLYYMTNKDWLLKPEYSKHFSQLTLIFSLVCFSDIFSYFLYCLLSLVLDSITIKKLKETIKEKEKHASANFDKEKFTQVERKGITMVVLSSLFNFLLRMPELMSIVILYFFVTQGNVSFLYACYYQDDCVSLVSIANVFYMLSVSTNLVFYVAFNSNFNGSFMKLMDKIRCRKIKPDTKNQRAVVS